MVEQLLIWVAHQDVREFCHDQAMDLRDREAVAAHIANYHNKSTR